MESAAAAPGGGDRGGVRALRAVRGSHQESAGRAFHYGAGIAGAVPGFHAHRWRDEGGSGGDRAAFDGGEERGRELRGGGWEGVFASGSVCAAGRGGGGDAGG